MQQRINGLAKKSDKNYAPGCPTPS